MPILFNLYHNITFSIVCLLNLCFNLLLLYIILRFSTLLLTSLYKIELRCYCYIIHNTITMDFVYIVVVTTRTFIITSNNIRYVYRKFLSRVGKYLSIFLKPSFYIQPNFWRKTNFTIKKPQMNG